MKTIRLLAFLACVAWLGCKTPQLLHASAPGNELFKVTILYPNGEGKTFNMDYYEQKHMPMVAGFLDTNLQFYEIDKGIAGRTPNDPLPYLAVGYFYIRNIADYQAAVGQHREAITSDFKNYTNIQPLIQISEVRKIGYAGKN